MLVVYLCCRVRQRGAPHPGYNGIRMEPKFLSLTTPEFQLSPLQVSFNVPNTLR